MDTLNTGFIWEYDDNSFEEKNLLIDTLPEGFKYRVKKLKIIEKSDVKEEVKFQTQIQVNICDKDEAEKFVQMIKNKNDTEMKPKMAIYCPQGSGTLRQQLLMMH